MFELWILVKYYLIKFVSSQIAVTALVFALSLTLGLRFGYKSGAPGIIAAAFLSLCAALAAFFVYRVGSGEYKREQAKR